MVCYTAVPVSWSIRIYIVIITNLKNNSRQTMSNDPFDELIYSDETKSQPWPMYIFFLFYMIGRYSSYIIIYLRLKQMLDNSIFAYKNKTYNKILFMLIIYGMFGMICMSVSGESDSIYYGSLALWVISDVTYFTSVTFMYLSKLREIKNVYEKSVLQTQISVTGTVSTESSIDCVSRARINPQTANTCKIDENIRNKIAALELAKIVTIYTKLSSTIFVSSFFLFLLISFGWIVLPRVFIVLVALLDCVINVFCSVLYFQNERNFYKKLFTLQLCCDNDG